MSENLLLCDKCNLPKKYHVHEASTFSHAGMWFECTLKVVTQHPDVIDRKELK